MSDLDEALALKQAPTPSVWRRLAAFLYEGVLLFGVLMVAGLLYSVVTRMDHALHGKLGLQVFLFVVLGAYCAGFWVRGGQTVAMKAWHVRVVDASGQALSWRQAVARYLLAWLWFLPALVVLWASGLKDSAAFAAALCVGVITYAGLTRLHPDRQFFHDVLCGTRLVTWRPAPRPQKGRVGA